MSVRRVVVLLEGASDVAALRTLLGRDGADGAVELVDMQGVTNVGRWLDALTSHDGVVDRVLGLCDSPERAHVRRALAEVVGVPEKDVQMERLGFHVCHVDLEDELIRALGPERAVALLEPLGLGARFAMFRQQPAWRDGALAGQLRRFAGVASGRKVVLAQALAAALPTADVPPPLRALLRQIGLALADPDGGPPVRPFPSVG